tara:strand:- start:454 stop:903 length:450 start_codon:yes stop_codon:yes gene_type:complete
MGVLGAVMLAVAVGALWTNKMKSHVVSADEHGDDELDDTARPISARNRSARIVMPIAPPQPQPAEELGKAEVKVTESPLETKNQPKDLPSVPEVSCPNAENNLTVAKTLSNIGDYEGASELAELVIQSTSSSKSQRARAAALVSRSRTR